MPKGGSTTGLQAKHSTVARDSPVALAGRLRSRQQAAHRTGGSGASSALLERRHQAPRRARAGFEGGRPDGGSSPAAWGKSDGRAGSRPRSGLREEFLAEGRAEVLGHQLLDHSLHPAPGLLVGIQKADPHPGVTTLALPSRPRHLTLQENGLVQGGHTEPEDEARPLGKRLLRPDERASLGDVAGVVREEGVQLGIIDPEFDGNPGVRTLVFPQTILHGG